jgi:hypothetical protein
MIGRGLENSWVKLLSPGQEVEASQPC